MCLVLGRDRGITGMLSSMHSNRHTVHDDALLNVCVIYIYIYLFTYVYMHVRAVQA